MKRTLLVLGLLIALFIVVSPVGAASIATDRQDYVPEETVTIIGTGFAYNDPVSIVVTRPDGTTPPDYPVTPNPVDPDASGAFTATYQLDGIQGTYTINAVSVGGISAEWTFTDAAAANLVFTTSGLPNGVGVTIAWSGTNNGNNPVGGPTTIVTPSSSAAVGLKQGSTVTYSFPTSITVGTITYTLQSTSPTSPHTMITTSDNPVPTTTVTATYSAPATPSDTTAPSTTIELSGTSGTNGWYTSAVGVTLTATDNEGGSGVEAIHYIFDDVTEITVAGDIASFIISDDGIHSLDYWAVDNDGNVELPHNTQEIKIDKTAPFFTSFVVPIGVLLNQPDVVVTWTASDTTSGINGTESGSVTVDTSSVGTKSGIITVYDMAGNSASATWTVAVGYNILGFLQPIDMDGSSIFKLKSTVPTKFQLTDYYGNYISTAVANLKTAKISETIVGGDEEAISTSAATTGSLFRYDTTADQYIFNLGTKTLSTGSYQIKAVLDSGQTIQVVIGLK